VFILTLGISIFLHEVSGTEPDVINEYSLLSEDITLYEIQILNYDHIIDGVVRVYKACEQYALNELNEEALLNEITLGMEIIKLEKGEYWIDISGRNIDPIRPFFFRLPEHQFDVIDLQVEARLNGGFFAVNVRNVSGAALYIDGDGPHSADEPIFLPFGPYTITVSHIGYEDDTQRIVFNAYQYQQDIYLISLIAPFRISLENILMLLFVVGACLVICIIALLFVLYPLLKRKNLVENIAHINNIKKRESSSIIATNLHPKLKKKNGDSLLPIMNFTIRKGALVCITGASGKGKTVLLKILAGYNRSYDGALEYEGDPQQEKLNWLKRIMMRYKVRNNVGYVPQHDALYPSVTPLKLLRDYYKLVTGTIEDMDERIQIVCTSLGISDDALLNRKIKFLSGGELKRVSIAIALLKRPDILLLDEPDSGLDLESRKELYQILRRINKAREATIIFSTHQFDDTLRSEIYKNGLAEYMFSDMRIFGKHINPPVFMHEEMGIDFKENVCGGEPKERYIEYEPTSRPSSGSGKRIPMVQQLKALIRREFRLYLENLKWLVFVVVLCMGSLGLATDNSYFDTYQNALAIAFAIVCAAILIGLMLSINLVGKNYDTLRRELHMGVSARGLVLSKTLVIVASSVVASFIVIVPYLGPWFHIRGLNKWGLFLSVFVTMLLSAGLGLLASIYARNKLHVASLSVPFIVLYQILFSGFIFTHINDHLRNFSISRYAIRAVGSALGFNFRDAPDYEFQNTFAHYACNLGRLIAGFAVVLIVCIFLMWIIRIKNEWSLQGIRHIVMPFRKK